MTMIRVARSVKPKQPQQAKAECAKLVWNVLEGSGLHLVLINPEHYKAVRGKKTVLKDGERIAELLQDG